MRCTLTAISMCLVFVSGCSPAENEPATTGGNTVEPARELTRNEKRDLVAEALSQRGVSEAGIYTVTANGRVEKMPIKVHYVELVSQNNENTSFTVTLKTSPFSDLGPEPYLYLDGRAYPILLVLADVIAGESINNAMRPSFGGEHVYEALLGSFEVEKRLRRHPGHQFQASFVPTAKVYELGEHPLVRFDIVNAGEVPFFHYLDDEWDLTVTRNGQTVGVREPDLLTILYRGPMTGLRFPLGPGESSGYTSDLALKYEFSQPGTYQVVAACGMSIHVVRDRSVASESGDVDVWDEKLEYVFEFTIKDAD